MRLPRNNENCKICYCNHFKEFTHTVCLYGNMCGVWRASEEHRTTELLQVFSDKSEYCVCVWVCACVCECPDFLLALGSLCTITVQALLLRPLQRSI